MINIVLFAVTILIFIAICLGIIRVLLGPRHIDRVVALDILLAASIMLCMIAAVYTQRSEFIDVAVGLALIGFIGTVGWAGLLERDARLRAQRGEQE